MNHLLDMGVNIAHRPVTAPVAGDGVSLVHIDDKQDIDAFTAQDPIIKNA